mmetsp:Transcript_49144/g.149597  ORF Transcript_49144/g.149597 Transcript_49144/m.149597 type:complete len:388 (-) Transcript_49144:58-1221(-)
MDARTPLGNARTSSLQSFEAVPYERATRSNTALCDRSASSSFSAGGGKLATAACDSAMRAMPISARFASIGSTPFHMASIIWEVKVAAKCSAEGPSNPSKSLAERDSTPRNSASSLQGIANESVVFSLSAISCASTGSLATRRWLCDFFKIRLVCWSMNSCASCLHMQSRSIMNLSPRISSSQSCNPEAGFDPAEDGSVTAGSLRPSPHCSPKTLYWMPSSTPQPGLLLMLRYLLTLDVNCICTSIHNCVSSRLAACSKLSHAAMYSTGTPTLLAGALDAAVAKTVRHSDRADRRPACQPVFALSLSRRIASLAGSMFTSCRIFKAIQWHALPRCSCKSAVSVLAGKSLDRVTQDGRRPSSRDRKPLTKALLIKYVVLTFSSSCSFS